MSRSKVVDRLIHVFVIAISVKVPLNKNQQQQKKNGTVLDKALTTVKQAKWSLLHSYPLVLVMHRLSDGAFCGCIIT